MIGPTILTHVLDTLDAGIAVYDQRGTTVHENTAFARLAELEHELRIASVVLAERVRFLASRAPSEGPVREALASAELRTDRADFRLKGSFVGEPTGKGASSSGFAVVSVRIATSDRISETLLQDQYGLTTREARVVTLLTSGRSNKQIARLLGISLHTARHHVERVMAKLGVSRRAQIPVVVLEHAGEG